MLLSHNELSAPANLVVKYDEVSKSCELVLSDGRVLWSSDPEKKLTSEYQIGGFWRMASSGHTSSATTARAILIQIGHKDFGLPSALFSEKLVVDDRPTLGGGLPDFWGATIARLISHIERNPNIAVVYILGKPEHGAQTAAKLREVGSWTNQEEQIAYRTGMAVRSIRTASSLLAGKIVFPESPAALTIDLADRLRPSHLVQPLKPVPISGKGSALS